ncbi:hypothetical protein CHLRE_08g371840v5 [Chlamydomonas reinhardtii]|uniref:Uncharacterized protein n=1 Tax=Chlamydomonas reinhardtii TaxID=3055 RepID=A0A2K3DHA5_CHLRE|nr:uncharacterized protein CHLRE_08g371840v5 [Chlamydomonas reinhardtii]PNW79914.1 hypothetical protein CHLRE_08g371840v5 [Chlamydomonas reinhardtii]
MACLVARLGHAPISAHSRSGSFPSNGWTLSRRPFRRSRAAADDGATDDFSPAVPSAKTVKRYVSRRGSRSSGSSDGKFSSLKSENTSLKSENTSLKSQLDSLKSQLDNERVGRSRDVVMYLVIAVLVVAALIHFLRFLIVGQ